MAVVVGIAIGVLNALPFLLSDRIAKRRRRHGKDLTLGMLLAMVMASLMVMSLSICICYSIAPDSLLRFAIAEVAAFLGCTVVYGVWVFFGPKTRRVAEGMD